MGYSYGVGPSGRWVLSCDDCGRADGTVRKVHCPWGYCPPPALCQSCRATPKEREARSPAAHRARGCEAGHLASEARAARESALIGAGGFVRCSAMDVGAQDPDGGPYQRAADPDTGAQLVQVVFRGAGGAERWYVMSVPTYRAVPIMEPATVADFEAHGPVVAGPVGYAHTPESVALVEAAWLFARGRARSLAGPAAPTPEPAAPPAEACPVDGTAVDPSTRTCPACGRFWLNLDGVGATHDQMVRAGVTSGGA